MNQEQILARVAFAFGVESQQLPAGNRAPHLVQARQAAAYVMHFQQRMSYAAIAEVLGYRDHSTAIWAVQAAANRARVNPNYSDKISQVGEL